MDTLHHDLNGAVGPGKVGRGKMMRAAIAATQLFDDLAFTMGTLVRNPIRDQPKYSKPLLQGIDHIGRLATVVSRQLA